MTARRRVLLTGIAASLAIAGAGAAFPQAATAQPANARAVFARSATSQTATSQNRSTRLAGPHGAGDAPARYLVALDDAASAPTVAAATARRVSEVVGAGHGTVRAVHEAVGTVVVDVTPAVAARLAAVAGVRSVTPDGVAHVQSLGYDPGSQPGSTVNVTRLTGAQAAWRRGITGAGVDVAVIDTGTTPVPSLRDAGKVVVGPDLSFDSQADNLRYLDGFGHGTHMASLIAGREVPPGSGAAYAEDTRNLYGMAPDARLVSIKVGDARGAVDVSQLIAAVDWVVQNRASGGLNIRVLNLSFGTDSTQSALLDPLSYAAEVAWRKGIVVVASAGNDGGVAAGLADPAYNGSILAVGAVDTQGTDSMADDAVPAFSQRPRNALYQRSPDLVAPGVGIVAAGVPGGYLWTAHPGARLGADQFRGSGTSQSAAVVSGAAALLLQRWPTLTPDALRELLTRTATPLRNATPAAQGDGELNVAGALASWPLTSGYTSGYFGGYTGGFGGATGTGTLEGARGSRHLVMDGVALTGERDVMGARCTPWLVAPLTRDARMWSAGGWFNGNRWTGDGFARDDVTVAGRTWGGRSWAGRSWAGSSWSGSAWAGRSWADAAWDGRSWAGQAWMDSAAGEPAPGSDVAIGDDTTGNASSDTSTSGGTTSGGTTSSGTTSGGTTTSGGSTGGTSTGSSDASDWWFWPYSSTSRVWGSDSWQ